MCKLNYGYHITRHILIIIFQSEHFSAVKFVTGYRPYAKYELSYDTKISKSLTKSNWAPLMSWCIQKCIMIHMILS